MTRFIIDNEITNISDINHLTMMVICFTKNYQQIKSLYLLDKFRLINKYARHTNILYKFGDLNTYQHFLYLRVQNMFKNEYENITHCC